jgi:hypothetical protein
MWGRWASAARAPGRAQQPCRQPLRIVRPRFRVYARIAGEALPCLQKYQDRARAVADISSIVKPTALALIWLVLLIVAYQLW